MHRLSATARDTYSKSAALHTSLCSICVVCHRRYSNQVSPKEALTSADEHLGMLDVVHALAEFHNEGPHSHVLLLQVCLKIIRCLACLSHTAPSGQGLIWVYEDPCTSSAVTTPTFSNSNKTQEKASCQAKNDDLISLR